MNEKAAINALYATIDGAKATLVSGITHQGVAREIKGVFKSLLTSPLELYSIHLHCASAEERFIEAANTVRGKDIALYNVEIHIYDYVMPQTIDITQIPFEKMHDDFRLLKGRIVKLIKDDTVVFADGDVSFRLVDSIRVENRTRWFDEGDQSFPLLYSIIRFELVDECADSSKVG